MSTTGLREKEYFVTRADNEMSENLIGVKRELREELAYAARIIGAKGHEAGLAGQISGRAEDNPQNYWTLRFGLGFEEARAEDFLLVDGDMHAVGKKGMGNPATRFHLWVYKDRPHVSCIIHAHSPWISALVAAAQPLVVAQMDMCPFYDDCAFLGEWPGLPYGDEEGEIISEALGNKRSIILANHGYLTTGRTVAEATYLAVLIERAARIQLRARVYGEVKQVPGHLAKESHDHQLSGTYTKATFDYWCRQVDLAGGQASR